MSWRDRNVVEKIATYLFSKFDGKDGEPIDTRTDIPTNEIFKTLTYYRLLESLGSEKSGKIANIIERLLISRNRKGREEGVRVLESKFPKIKTLFSSVEEMSEGE